MVPVLFTVLSKHSGTDLGNDFGDWIVVAWVCLPLKLDSSFLCWSYIAVAYQTKRRIVVCSLL